MKLSLKMDVEIVTDVVITVNVDITIKSADIDDNDQQLSGEEKEVNNAKPAIIIGDKHDEH